MKTQSVKRQAAVLACANGAVRGLGFLLHVALGRMLGAEALGVFELAHSAHMLAVTPVTAGLPAAVSRVTARRGDGAALAAGRRLATRVSLVFIPAWLLLSPWIAGLLGDPRTLLSLWVCAPCMLAVGLTAVYSGYCYGRGLAWPPALATLTEQAARFALCAVPLLTVSGLTIAARAAIPGAAELLAEAAALTLMVWLLREARPRFAPDRAVEKELVRLSLPLTGTRLMQTLSRALMAALLPRCLVTSGLPAARATAAVGMLHGMVMPVLFLPGILTAALGMAGAPAIARREGAALRRMAGQLTLSSLACGLAGWGGIHLLAGFLADTVYREPALRGLFAAAAPLTLLFALGQGASTLLAGLGEQKKALLPTAVGTALTLLLTARWAASPLRLYGAVYALLTGRAVTVLWQLAAALPAFTPRSAAPAEPSDG